MSSVIEWYVQKTLDRGEANKARLRLPSGGLFHILKALGGDNYKKVYDGKAINITFHVIHDEKPFELKLKRYDQHYYVDLPGGYHYVIGDKVNLGYNKITKKLVYLIEPSLF